MKIWTLSALTILAVCLVGCDSNPTNEPSKSEIDKAVQSKYEAIDKDTTMTPAQKEEMKKHMSGAPGQSQDAGRK
jgi:PBP1b-binding outer membrane lipoprotein LpoB